MKNKAIKTIIIFSIIASILGVIGFTYSYFSLEVEGNSKDIVLATGDLKLKYTDTSVLNLENALPGDSITKTLIVENIGTKDTSYNIVWKDLINQINYYDLHLDMKCKSYKNYGENSQEEYGECKSFYKAVPYTETKINKDIKRDIKIEVGVTQVYELTITFLNRVYSQDENLNKSFSGRIELEEYVDDSVYCYSESGSTYINGQYTYTSLGSNGWSVHLTDKTSTEPVNTVLCTYINDRPITSFYNTFRDSEAISIDLGKINTKNVTDMNTMFMNSKAATIKGLELFDTSKVTEMQHMFREANFSALDLSSFDTSNVTTFFDCFVGNKATYIDISSFDTSNVTDMSAMFLGSSLKYLDLSNFDTSNVTNMAAMFQSSLATEVKGIDSFDTSNVTEMSWMFYFSKITNLDLRNFNTSKVTNMARMFQGSSAKTLDLSSFNIEKVTDMNKMFSGTKATIGYAKDSATAAKFNDSSVTSIPSTLKFTVK